MCKKFSSQIDGKSRRRQAFQLHLTFVHRVHRSNDFFFHSVRLSQPWGNYCDIFMFAFSKHHLVVFFFFCIVSSPIKDMERILWGAFTLLLLRHVVLIFCMSEQELCGKNVRGRWQIKNWGGDAVYLKARLIERVSEGPQTRNKGALLQSLHMT